MAEAKAWYDESMGALKKLQEINGWDTEDDDYQNRFQDIKEGFNRKFDEEMQPAAAVLPGPSKGKAKGKDRKKRMVPPWDLYAKVKAKKFDDVVEKHKNQLPPCATEWVLDRTAPNADAEGKKKARRYVVKGGGGAFIIRVIEEIAGKEYNVMYVPSNWRAVKEKELQDKAAGKAPGDAPAPAPTDTMENAPAAAGTSQAPAPAVNTAPSPSGTRASRSRTAAGVQGKEAAAEAPVAAAPAAAAGNARKPAKRGRA